MKVVTGLVLPSRGVVKVAGDTVTGPVKNVGTAFQNATLLPWRTIMDNILLPFGIRSVGDQRAFRDELPKRVDDG
jgi:NitT/TauT family transport system ATP-binding protein